MYQYDNPLDLTHVLIFTCVCNLVRHLESSIFSLVCDPNINIKILLESSLLFAYSPMISARNLRNFSPCSGFIM